MTNLQKGVERPSSFLRGEPSAVQTYDQAFEKLHDETLRGKLLDGRSPTAGAPARCASTSVRSHCTR